MTATNLLKSLQGLVCGLMFTAVLCSPLRAQTSAEWRSYEVYQPKVKRGFVVEAALDGLAYSHCPTLMWFKGRWFCAWNGNELPDEGTLGQQVWMSTSRDGVTWPKPFAPFSSAALCETPSRDYKAIQWQPEFIVVNDQLWCFFCMVGKEGGCYFAQLAEPDGKWSIRRLRFSDASLNIDGHRIARIFPSQNPVQLRSGRVLVPVILWTEDRASDVPKEAKDDTTFGWTRYRHVGVLYSDDLGKTWSLSPGCTMPNRTWCAWEPTVWEQSDGSVLMAFRNNSRSGCFKETVRPSQYMIGSRSRDGGKTWDTPDYIPIETVCSRMYVAPLDGKGIWNPVVPGDDYKGRLQLMFHNDLPSSGNWAGERRNLAVYFKRGDGFEFTAGPGFTGNEPSVCYPQHAIHDGALVVTYNQNFSRKRSIRYARITPLPDPAKRYLLPRSDTVPSWRPGLHDGFLRFEGEQQLVSREAPAPNGNRVSLSAWIRWKHPGTLIETGAGGLLWKIGKGKPDGTSRVPSPCLFFSSHASEPSQILSTLALPSPLKKDQRELKEDAWIYVGLDLDPDHKTAVFYVDDRSEKVAIAPAKHATLKGALARVGWGGLLPMFFGDIRFLAMFDEPIGESGHRYLHDRFAADVGQKPLAGGAPIPSKPLLWMDPSDPQFARQWTMPDGSFQGGRTVKEDGLDFLRFFGEGSAGVDVDENHRDRGDKVELRFRFKIESGNEQVICTTGDANQPARVVASKGQVLLSAGNQQQSCGKLPTSQWADLQITTFGNRTIAQLDNQPPVEVTHTPRGTWIYLGQGYQTGTLTPDDRFLIDASSVQSRVTRSSSSVPPICPPPPTGSKAS
jgi:hypothetical protein